MRRSAKVGVASLLGLAGGWLLAEAALRLAPDRLPLAVQTMTHRRSRSAGQIERFYADWRSLLRPDPLLGYRYHPSIDLWLAGHPDFSYRLRTNSRGFRSAYELGPVDAIAVGDSFTMGHGVDESDTWVVRLSALTGRKVANLGIGGFGALNELPLLETEGLRLQPRLVIWQFFEDDLANAGAFLAWRRSGQEDFLAWQRAALYPPAPTAVAQGRGRHIRGFLHRHALTYELAKYALHAGPYVDGSGQQVRARVGGHAILLDPATHDAWTDLDKPEIDQGWQASQLALLRGRELAHGAGAQFVVVLCPAKEDVYAHLLRSRPAGRPLEPGSRNGLRMASFCSEAAIPCVDLHPAFVSSAQTGQMLYFGQDAHWNSAGHALAAQVVYRFLEAEGMSWRQPAARV